MELIDIHFHLTSKRSIKKIILKCFSLYILFFLISGCSVSLVKTSDPYKELQYARRIDPNEGPLRISQSAEEPNRTIISWDWEHEINLSKPCLVKYQTFYFDFIDLIVVPGTLPNGKTYSVWLDTGFANYALTNGLTILENDLAVYPLGEQSWTSAQHGLCYLPYFRMGDATIINPPCEYLQQQWEVKILGLSIWRQKGMLMGLGLMKGFGYIVFDNINKEVGFAPGGHPFVPTQPKQWDSYPFEIKNQKLIVNIPIESRYFSSEFDTCGSYGMVVSQDIWQRLPSKTKTSDIKKSYFLSGFLGELQCYRTKIKSFKIANQIVKSSEIIILPEGGPYSARGVNISISMKYFKNTVVVLDFKQNLMWIKASGTD